MKFLVIFSVAIAQVLTASINVVPHSASEITSVTEMVVTDGPNFVQTTMKPDMVPTTTEPFEQDYFSFQFDPHSNQLAALYRRKCHLYTLTYAERMEVHTTAGLRKVELKMLSMIDDTDQTYTTMTKDQLFGQSHKLAHFCRDVTIIKMD